MVMQTCLYVHLFKIMVAFSLSTIAYSATLSPTFYDKVCPKALSTIKGVVKDAVNKESRMGASLLRLHFHDCFVNGCDASLLLDDSAKIDSEKNAFANVNSTRGFEVVDKIKSEVDKVCGGAVVSCADILAIVARDSVVALGGPSWNVKLGRRDSKTASQSAANNGLPPPTSSLSNLISKFSAVGLSTKDMVALSGAHTIGLARCTNFRARIYNETIDSDFAQTTQKNCSKTSGSGDNKLAPLDILTPTSFDNSYFKNVINNKGLLHSDQQLFTGASTVSIVRSYSSNLSTFISDFTAAMIKMGDISPLTGSSGEIRKNCRKTN